MQVNAMKTNAMKEKAMRVKTIIAYDGSSYLGFQKQSSTKQTITHVLECALRDLQIPASIVGSGRTDAGVHAANQVIHFDVPSYWHDLEKLKLNLNRKLDDISVKHITQVPDDFHARFWAKKRVYRYVFKTSKPSVFEQKYISYYANFDEKVLSQALECFLGEHDFAYFRKTGSDIHTSVRNIYAASYKKRDDYHFIYFTANGFLRAQVRMMINAAMLVAQGKLPIIALQEQIDLKKRHTTSLAPPQGLYLARILYTERNEK